MLIFFYCVLFVNTFILLKDTGLQQLVDQLLHGVESTQESLRRHNDTHITLRCRSFSVFFRLESYKIETNHSTGKMNLTDAISENFFLIHSNEISHDKHLSLFMTINILPTNHYFQQQWLYCRLSFFNIFSYSNNLIRQSLSSFIPSSPFKEPSNE